MLKEEDLEIYTDNADGELENYIQKNLMYDRVGILEWRHASGLGRNINFDLPSKKYVYNASLHSTPIESIDHLNELIN